MAFKNKTESAELGNNKKILFLSADSLMRSFIGNFLSHFNNGAVLPPDPDVYFSDPQKLSFKNSIIIYELNEGRPESNKQINKLKEAGKHNRIILLASEEQMSFVDEISRDTSWQIVKKPFLPKVLKTAILEAASDSLSFTGSQSAGKPQNQRYHPQLLLGVSPYMEEVKAIIDQVANTDVTVLIRGESGTGKELIAKTMFDCSGRAEKPYVTVLCPAIPEPLLESELFGYEKGSFTGAFRRRPGKFEIANRGTIFLDEIGDIPFELQSKLLHVLQGGEVARIGGSDQKVDVRIIAATNKDLEKGVVEGTFREDLFYRLNVVSLRLPSLRSRKDDIPLLVDLFLDKYSKEYNKQIKVLSSRTLDCFMNYNWPGNIRELENLVKRIVIMDSEQTVIQQYFNEKDTNKGNGAGERLEDQKGEGTIPLSSEPKKGPSNNSGFLPLKDVAREAMRKAEGEAISRALEATRWNRKAAAKLLQISYKALLYKIRQCELDGGNSPQNV